VARYSFPALGFDPASGNPDAVDGVAQDCTRCAQELADDANRLRQVQSLVSWQGEAATAFASHPTRLRDDLLTASHAYGGAGFALTAYATSLRQAQFHARRIEDTAAEAQLRIDRHGAEADRLTALIESTPPGISTADQEFERDGFRRRQAYAQEEYDAAVARARRIALALEQDGDRAAARVRSLGNAPYHQPGLLSRLAGGAADWIGTHADALRALSNVLKTVSAVAGLLSFFPVLTPIFAPIAGITAVGALGIDAALVATGHGDWKSLAVDAALMAVPVAGKVASRAVMAGKQEGVAAQVEGAGVASGVVLDGAAATTKAYRYATQANKLEHIFAAKHGFEPLVAQYGSQQAVVSEILASLRGHTPTSGMFEETVHVGGRVVVVRGSVVDAMVKIGTAFLR
jgi:uncharacterized protein YukE